MGWKDALAALRERATGATDDREPPELVHARAATAAKCWHQAAAAWREVVELPTVDVLGAEPWAELGRAHRLDRELDAALEVVERGRSRFPTDLRLIVEAARLALRGYAASDEDDRHLWKARVLAARGDLAAARERHAISKPALQAAGEIELVLRRWSDALTLWEQLEERYPDRRDEALIKQAATLRAMGDLPAARARFRQVSAAAAGSDAALALEETIAGNEMVAAANEVFVAASTRWHAGEVGVLRTELPVALAARGHTPERVTRVLPLLEDLSAFVDAGVRGDTRPPGTAATEFAHTIGEQRPVVVVSGLLYSGSGAVFDLLRGYEGYHLPYRQQEAGFLKKPRHLATILERRATRFPDPATTADAILACTFGFGQSGRPFFGWVAPDEERSERLVQQLRWLVAELHRTWAEDGARPDVAVPATTATLRRFLDAVVADRTPADRVALLNNAIIGHQLERLQLLSRSIAIPVLRDPRDQYVSQKLESPYAMACEDFITMMTERFAAVARSLRDPEVAPQVIPVRFERFVEDAAVRRDLLERLGIASPQEPETFRAERSRRNIGIHREYPERDEITRISDALLGPFETLTASW
jgi:tetratricopeptide (TPR) repeat protein